MIASTTDELACIFRSEVDDVIIEDGRGDADRIWKTADVYRYMTVAVDALARDTRSLERVIRLTVTGGEREVRISDHVLDIHNARLVTTGTTLREVNTNQQSEFYVEDYGSVLVGRSSMFSNAAGTPTAFVRDYARKALILVPSPVSDDELEVQCSVTLNTPMTAGMLLPFTAVVDQLLLLAHMKSQAYMKQDADALDAGKANAFRMEYLSGSVERTSEYGRVRRAPGNVRMDW